jgi:hypothetical protein
MLGAILDFALIWLVPFGMVFFLIPAFYTNNDKSFSGSTFWMLVSAALAYIYFRSDINPIVVEHGVTTTILYLVVAYIVAGLATSFIYWIFYNWKAKERFDNYMNEQKLPRWADGYDEGLSNSLKKYLVLNDYAKRKDIFDDPRNGLGIDIETVKSVSRNENLSQGVEPFQVKVEELDAAVGAILPPRFKNCKYFIVGAGCSWPITIVWLLASRVVKQLIERFVSLFGGTFDKLSRAAFGKF